MNRGKGCGSPLDVPGINAGLSRAEIVELVRESRRSTARLLNKTRAPQKPLRREKKSRKRQGSAGARDQKSEESIHGAGAHPRK
jgi:hypothetical protein